MLVIVCAVLARLFVVMNIAFGNVDMLALM